MAEGVAVVLMICPYIGWYHCTIRPDNCAVQDCMVRLFQLGFCFASTIIGNGRRGSINLQWTEFDSKKLRSIVIPCREMIEGSEMGTTSHAI